MLLTKPNELVIKLSYAGLIYGQPGVGKTTLALSSVNPVCIDVDQGMYRIEKRYQVPSLQMNDYNQLLELLNSNEINNYETIVVDTLGKLIDRISDYVTDKNPKYRQSNGQLTMQGWGQVKIEFRALVKLINSKNKSVLFVAHESEEKEGDVTKKRPDVSGSARKDIVKELDFMGYMEMSGNKRTISFTPNSSYYAKNCLRLDAVIEVPDISAANSFIQDTVVASLIKKKKEDADMAAPYENLIAKVDMLVEAAIDANDINSAYKEISGLAHIWDSKIYAWHKISGKAKELGMHFNKAKNSFQGKAV